MEQSLCQRHTVFIGNECVEVSCVHGDALEESRKLLRVEAGGRTWHNIALRSESYQQFCSCNM
jgi:myosin-crossreactive antigen